MANNSIKSVNLLPEFFRTDKNSKFLSSTLDQLIQPPQLERIDGYIGTTATVTYSTSDVYISQGSDIRRNYELEPALIINDNTGNIKKAIGIDDLSNEIIVQGGIDNNFDRLYRSNFYSYDPHIDWDKFVNYQEYYWLTTGPETIVITGQEQDTTSTYIVSDNGLNSAFILTPDGLTPNPLIKLYRGNTYYFEVNSSNNFYIKTSPSLGNGDLYNGVINNGTSTGVITFTVDASTPSTLYYATDDLSVNHGEILIRFVDENSYIDVDLSIVGKKTYTSGNGVTLSNGMKIRFDGDVSPAYYQNKDFFVEGVGTAIRLVDYESLSATQVMSNQFDDNFDATLFDDYPFDTFKQLPITPEYITINRGSQDLNPWSRYNRWVHHDVITLSAELNGTQPVYPSDKRAQRPIIEFKADIQLYNFGTTSAPTVDLIDTTTLDAFKTVEGSFGYHIDGVLLEQGHRVIFNADVDELIRGRVYEVTFVTVNGKSVLKLNPTVDSIPLYKSSIIIDKGTVNSGTSWWYNGVSWVYSQQHTTLNQSPLFDLFDNQGQSYSDTTVYSSSFLGNKIFGYDIAPTGTNDPILGFPLQYQNSVGVGSYLFKNYFTTDTISISQSDQTLINISTGITYLKIGNEYFNVWQQAEPYQIPTPNGVYDVPLGLTNNPLNGPIPTFTLSEITDHVNTMINRDSDFTGNSQGINNLRDIPNPSKYGTRLISNANSMVFPSFFIGNKEHNVVDAIQKAGDQYNEFKMQFLKQLSLLSNQTDYVSAVDTVLTELNKNKQGTSSYSLSDMVAYGQDTTTRTWTVTSTRNTVYPISSDFNLTSLSLRSVLVYLNGNQLINGRDYIFISNDSSIEFLVTLNVGDAIEVKDYYSTEGCYVPPTPTKLGLYPKYVPEIYVDDTYISGPQSVIRGHDGSITIAYNDYRDQIILELETRIYNNIKVLYRPELFDIHSILPGAFRNSDYTYTEINEVLERDFIKWAGLFGIDYSKNDSVDDTNSFTWNYTGGYNNTLGVSVNGYWRNVYRYFYDTDTPHLTPWEMLGFTEQPEWWTAQYGPAPYTSGNDILWGDIEAGMIADGPTAGVNPFYARPGLSKILPVDQNGNLKNPDTFLVENITLFSRRNSFVFGDQGPVETAWRRSSYYPFALQRLLALVKPASYTALMYDTSRMNLNISGQWTYGSDYEFLNPKNLIVFSDKNTLTSGYSVYISEIGQQRSSGYLTTLQNDLSYLDLRLFHKVGGFVSKNKIQIIIDAYDPTSTSPGALLPQEDYQLFLNVSNPVSSVGISGIIIQKSNGEFIVKGYDKYNPYFNVYQPSRNSTTPAITVGGVSEPYIVWTASSSSGNTGLSEVDTTTAVSSTTGVFYQAGQIVLYGNRYYRVKVSHRSGTNFDPTLFAILPSLPIIGGVTVQTVGQFSKEVTQVSYGTAFSTLQEVYDFIIGYGQWLINQGFIFDEFNPDLNSLIDWNFSAKEFLYWTTQNWADNSIITLSPFADQIKFSLPNSVVDNIFNSFYEYSILTANGKPFPQHNLNVNRQTGVCTINTIGTTEGIYFAQLNSVQKEHAMVFNNSTIFNDTIFDIETGYRQLRMKLVGFRTSNWEGDLFSPGFVYDEAIISNWQQYIDYNYGSVVKFNSNYYSAANNISGSESFNTSDGWILLGSKPVADLIPNFDYKINQFEDFYSLDIDNFDAGQQKMAQHLIGYTPRVYLNNIFTDPIAQYKFYQGYIKEKGTKNSISKLAKATINNLQGQIDYTEEWAFRVGNYGSYQTYQEIEFPLAEGTFIENPQILSVVSSKPSNSNDLVNYILPSDVVITPTNFNPDIIFSTNSGTYYDNDLQLNTAGYVRIDDVDSTAYNENSILDIANNSNISVGNTIWIGFKSNGEWDVVRYEKNGSNVIGVYVSIPLSQLTFTTDHFHNLSVGSIVSITQFDDQVNGVYKITSIPSLTSFTVSTNLGSIATATPGPGLMFEFKSYRFPTFEAIPSDTKLLSLPYGSKLWVDNDGTGRWAVYQKINNYSSSSIVASSQISNQSLGKTVYKQKGDSTLIVGATSYEKNQDLGRVFVYNESTNGIQFQFSYTINSNKDTSLKYYTVGNSTEFGSAIAYDNFNFNQTGYGLIFAGAPGTSNVISTSSTAPLGGVRHSTGTGIASSYAQEGLVKISSVDPILFEEGTSTYVLLSPDPFDNQRFGSSIYAQQSTSTKILLVGAPSLTTSTFGGNVYSYIVDATSSIINVHTGTTGIEILNPRTQAGDQWGYSIEGSNNAEKIAVSAPNWNNGVGFVSIYTGSNLSLISQIIESPFGLPNARFGEAMAISPKGDYLVITAPELRNEDQSFGKVAIYTTSSDGSFTLTQIISNPLPGAGMKFGRSIDINTLSNTLVIGSVGYDYSVKTIFDKDRTTEDSSSTVFTDSVENAGTAYIYVKKSTNGNFHLADSLSPDLQSSGSYYGTSVTIDQNIYVGAPAIDGDTISSFYQFSKINVNADSWETLRSQDDLVDITQFQSVKLVDTFNEQIVEYLDVIDPVKGKLPGLAQEEIRYKSASDPAVYSIGVSGTVVDTNTNWLDDQVGELWWDLSTVKYFWYEQGELEYRRSNWGQIFPGATIDVYEWVGSEYLPSEWSSQADTSAGLTEGISGQPKYADNSVISVKQIYSSVTNSFSNYYYYWVKNKVTIPNVKNRRISAYQVSSLIADPTSYGYLYASVLSKNAVSLANVGNLLVGNRINLNVATDIINNPIEKHTEWLLLQEGSATSVPNTLLEKKLFDSLLGHDSLGNPVPDPALSSRMAYGIEIRPRQSMFVNRKEALRNLIEFSNLVLAENQITGNYSFTNLNQQELPPDVSLHEYDQIVEDNEQLSLINTLQFVQATIQCTMYNGKVRSVAIENPGYGYLISPNVIVSGTSDVPAVISTEINSLGQLVNVTIENPGAGYDAAPSLTVRPYTVIVLVDSTYNNKWAEFVWNSNLSRWDRAHTQKYNTTLYWKYIDWESTDYNPYIDYTYTVDAVYDLFTLPNLQIGEYVKVKNGGDGNYIILEQIDTSAGAVGTFDTNFNLVYKQNGTIQLLDNIWNSISGTLNFDSGNSYDQTLYDQTPDIELGYILSALRNDLFVLDLKINWNLFFFKAVKYALSEQKLLDWAFKTSFINVVNYSGELTQPPVYKLQDTSYYEDYLSEVKPYHTQIRSFTTNRTVVDPTQSYITDFDLPSIYNTQTGMYQTIDINSSLLNSYPWKSWADNYTFEIGSISVGNPGANYVIPPIVEIVSAPGDNGSGATAQAYITSGKVSQVIVTNPGSGYTQPPSVILHSAGNSSLVQATAYAQLTNNKVRSNQIGIKFDRTSSVSQINSTQYVDEFVCNGSETEFVLSWLATPDKSTITVTLDGTYVLTSDYTIQYYTEEYNGYNKKFCKLIFLNYVPTQYKLLTITYNKNIELFNAVDRILNYYNPTSGMPGIDIGQLMTGIDYPGTIIESLPFDYTTVWGVNTGTYGISQWDTDVNYYTLITATSTASIGTNTITLSTTTGISVGQLVNIISTTTDKFSVSTITQDISVIGINSTLSQVTFNSTFSQAIVVGEKFEFWSIDSNTSSLDSVIDGGTWGSSDTGVTLVNALGVNPEDINFDGGAFLSSDQGFAPEELIPGQTADSLAINVYTKNVSGAPLVFSGSFAVSTNTITTSTLAIAPTSIPSIMVVYNGIIFQYSSSTSFLSSVDSQYFTIDWGNNNILVSPQSNANNNPLVGYTIVSVGGSQFGAEAGVIDSSGVSFTSGETVGEVRSGSSIGNVNTASVYVNGVWVPRQTLGYNLTTIGLADTTCWYELGPVSSTESEAAVVVYNMPAGSNYVLAWFFGTEYQYFNEIREQDFIVGGSPQYTFTLSNPPGNIEPAAAQAIVELNDNGLGWKILNSPPVSYYTVTNPSTLTYAIDNKTAWPFGAFNVSNVSVYINGTALNPGFDFTVDSINANITLTTGLITNGDVIAVLSLPDGGWDYNIVGSTLILAQQQTTQSLIKVITYTDQDSMLIRTERFPGNSNGRFKISRPTLNDNYVWVRVNGIPLIRDIQYVMLDDGVTVQIADNVIIQSTDIVEIMSISDTVLATTILGYRIFNDIFNRTSFKRLSKQNTTYLTQPLKFTDTEIYVADSSVLTPPLVSKKLPGVVIIEGERIEFYKLNGNVLSQLRRATLGTSPSYYLEINTKVIDQSPEQTVPFSENVYSQSQLTTAGVNTYIISTATTSYSINTSSYNISHGIILQSNPVGTPYNDPMPAVNAVDQVEVYYGGRRLRKAGMLQQDITLSYDSQEFDTLLTTSTSALLPSDSPLGTAYITADTNKVWVQTNAVDVGSINGFVYKGLQYIPPEYTITTATQALTLNLLDGVQSGIKLTVVKKEFARDTVWNDEVNSNTTISLMNSSKPPALFLQARPAELPDVYYYGGDPMLTTDSGLVLTDNQGNPLEGI